MSRVAVLPELTDQGLAQGMVRGDEVLNLDDEAASTREVVNDALLGAIRTKIKDAGADLRANRLLLLSSWCTTCDRCDLAGLRRTHP